MHFNGCWIKTQDQRNNKITDRFNLNFSDQVTVIENDSVKVIYQGTVFNRSDQELLKNHKAFDDAFGVFTYIYISKMNNEAFMGTDKLGFSPLYFAEENHKFFFSTSLTFLKHKLESVTPNYEAIYEILNIETILGDKTTIQEIDRLSFGTKIYFKDNKLKFQKYWKPEHPERIEEKTFIKKNNELLFEALELTRNHTNPKIVLLSGGEDSRRICLMTKKIGLPVTFATQSAGIRASRDTDSIISKLVSDYLKVPLILQKHPSFETIFKDIKQRDYWLGYETTMHEWILPLLRNIPKNSLLYDGIAGDVIINGHWTRLYPEQYDTGDIDKISKFICKHEKDRHLNFYNQKSTLFERVREQIIQYPVCNSRVDYYYILNRARRNISLLSQLYSLYGHLTCYPFLYYPFFMHSLSLSPKIKKNTYYQHKCMAEIDSGLVNIPSTRKLLEEKYYKNINNIARKLDLVIARRGHFSLQVKKIYSHLKIKMLIFKLASFLGSHSIINRLGWRIFPILRLSEYFDWIEDNTKPELRVLVEHPEFRKSKKDHENESW